MIALLNFYSFYNVIILVYFSVALNRQLVVGNTVGEQALLDVRNKRCLGKYKGGAGAIRSIQCHPTLPLVVSCGLDRYIRIHDMNTRALTNKVGCYN